MLNKWLKKCLKNHLKIFAMIEIILLMHYIKFMCVNLMTLRTLFIVFNLMPYFYRPMCTN